MRSLFGSMLVWITRPKVSLWRTIYFNFYFLPVAQAVRLPIYVYGKPTVLKCEGSIIVDCPLSDVYRGMIKLNQNVGSPGMPGGNLTLDLEHDCKITFKGKAMIAHNSKLLLWGGSVLTIGAGCCLGLGSDICCSKSITLHDDVRLGSEVKVYDTNFHYTYKKRDLAVHPCSAPIELGHHCWVGSRSTIMKGVNLRPHTTVASNSVVNKNITDRERTLIGGIPARVLSDDFSRVFNKDEEWKIYCFFRDLHVAGSYQLTDQLDRYN